MAQPDIASLIANAKLSLRAVGPGESDLPAAGQLFQDDHYFDGLPRAAQNLICAVQTLGEHPDRPQVLYGAGLEHLQAGTDLLSAASLLSAAVKFTLPADVNRVARLHACGRAFQQLWRDDKNDLELALHFYRRAALVAEQRQLAALPVYLTDVAFMLAQQYDVSKSSEDEKEIAGLFARASELSEGNITHAVMLSNEADFMRSAAENAGMLESTQLRRAVQIHERAVAALVPSTPNRGQILRNAAVAYGALFNTTSQLVDSDRALEIWSQAVEVDSRWQTERIDHLTHRYVVSSDKGDLEAALLGAQDVDGSKVKAIKAFCLNQLLDRRNDNAAAQLDEAQSLIADALGDDTASVVLRAKWYHWSSGIQSTLFEHTGRATALELGVKHAIMAADLETAAAWNHHRTAAEALNVQYDHTRDPVHLRTALGHARRAIELVPQWRDQNLAQCCWTYGKLLSRQLIIDSLLETFRESIEMLQGALIIDGKDKVLVLNDIGNVYATQFSKDHDLKTAGSSSDAYFKALDLLEDTDWHDIGMIHAGIGNIMLNRYLVWGSVSDVEVGMKHYFFSVKDLSTADARFPSRVCNLAYALQLRFTYDQDVQYLLSSQLALDKLTGIELSSTARMLAMMHQGNGQQHLTTALDDPERKAVAAAVAIESYEEVLALATELEDEVTMRQAANNLAATKAGRAQATGSTVDLEEALEAYDIAEVIIGEHPDIWALRSNLVGLLVWADERSGSSYATRTVGLLEELLQTSSLTVSRRIFALSSLAPVVVKQSSDYARAASCLEEAADLLPQAILSHSNRLEQLQFVRKFAFLPSSAAAVYAASGKSAAECVAVLERSRGFLNHRRLEAAAIDQEKYPDDFKKLQEARQAIAMLERPIRPGTSTSLTSAAARQVDLQRSHRTLEEAVARLKLDPVQTPELQVPVIWVNLSRYRSDAFVLFAGEFERVPLEVDMDEVGKQCVKYLEALDLAKTDFHEAEQRYKAVMKWLWCEIAKPIVTAVKATRVYWVGSGWLSILPIHAAGDFSIGESVHSSVVSSYISSLEGLIDMQKRLPAVQRQCDQPKALLVGMNTTPGLPPLNAREELDVAIPGVILQDEDATYAAVAKGLQTSDVVHFACHGQANMEDPSLSALILSDHATKPLHIRSIMRMKLQCGLCFLSACESGLSKDFALRDESVHIAGALQMAGAINVIASMWTVADDVCLALAKGFYSELASRSDEGISLAAVPYAFHAAVEEICRAGVSPLLWGAWFHAGV